MTAAEFWTVFGFFVSFGLTLAGLVAVWINWFSRT